MFRRQTEYADGMKTFFTELPEYQTEENGVLRIKARIFKEGVYKVKGSEAGDPADFVNVYYPLKEFVNEKSFKQLETIPVIVGHTDFTAEEMKDVKKGHIAGIPKVDDGGILSDIIIDDPETAKNILNKQLRDVSISFFAKSRRTDGRYEGTDYEYVFEDISYDHIGLLPEGEGRMGREVKVFNNREDKVSEEEKKDGSEEFLKKLVSEVENLKNENLKLVKQLEDRKTEVSEEVIEDRLKEITEDNKSAEIIDAVMETKISNSGLFGEKLYDKSLSVFGLDTSKISLKKEAFYVLTGALQKMCASGAEKTPVKVSNSTECKYRLSSENFRCNEDAIEANRRLNMKKEKAK